MFISNYTNTEIFSSFQWSSHIFSLAANGAYSTKCFSQAYQDLFFTLPVV